MNDITYTFNQTNRERKALVPSALKRTSGSKSRKCSLPSDNLTEAQKKRLSGPVYKYNLSVPMTWGMFKLMPKDLQEEYLTGLFHRFSIGTSLISEYMFNLDKESLYRHIVRQGLDVPRHRGRPSNNAIEIFKAWVANNGTMPEALLTNKSEPVEPVEIVKPVSSVEPSEPVKTGNPATRTITLANLTMRGTAADVIATLRNFLNDTDEVELEVNIKFKEENK